MNAATVTPIRPSKDPTNAERQRRWRARKAASVTAIDHNAVDTVAACELAGKLQSGRATLEDIQAAARLILELVKRVPEVGQS